MSVISFLDQAETLLKSGHATEHSFRPALAGLFNSMLAAAQATNEPKHAEYGAPDFGIYRGSTPARPDSPATQSFTGIDPATQEMHIGGYQPLEKWLKDRRGRKLAFDDIQHYLRMVIALHETRRITEEIDALIPGWPLV